MSNVYQEGRQSTLQQKARKEYVLRHAIVTLYLSYNLWLCRVAESTCSAISWNKRARKRLKRALKSDTVFIGSFFVAEYAVFVKLGLQVVDWESLAEGAIKK